MRIFISSDMEGTAGVVDWDQCRPGRHDYEYYRDLLQAEVNAAIEGALDAAGGDGPPEFLVNDSHGRMANLRPAQLAGGASYLSGRHKPMYMMQGLDDSFDAVFFVSYHGSMTGTPATLSHTYNPLAIAEVRLNGVLTGESGINALVAAGHGVPIALITGDATTAAELKPFCPQAKSAVVKQSVSRFAAESLHPAKACALIRTAARDAVAELNAVAELTAVAELAATDGDGDGDDNAASRSALPLITLPATLTVRLRNPDIAEMATWLERVVPDAEDPSVVHLTDEDLIRLYRTFVTLVMLTRGIAE